MDTQGDKHLRGSTCIPLPECPARKSFDKLNGIQLLQLCRTLGLYRLRRDSLGHYTYSSALGSCTVVVCMGMIINTKQL